MEEAGETVTKWELWLISSCWEVQKLQIHVSRGVYSLQISFRQFNKEISFVNTQFIHSAHLVIMYNVHPLYVTLLNVSLFNTVTNLILEKQKFWWILCAHFILYKCYIFVFLTVKKAFIVFSFLLCNHFSLLLSSSQTC